MKSLQPAMIALAVTVVVSIGATLPTAGQNAASAKKSRAPTTSFSEDVFPIFKGRCIDCHRPGGAGYEASGLDLTTYEGVMKGTKFGKMVIPGDPDTSNLMWLLEWRGKPETRMPHGQKQLSICDRTAIRRWILDGAPNN
jgi:mono/diheme cytochrome c family protein